MVIQQGRAVLALIFIVILLTAGSFYLGRYTKTQVAPQPTPISVQENILRSPSIISTVPSVNPFEQRSTMPQPKNLPSPALPKADVEIAQGAEGKVYSDNKHGFSYKFSKTLTLNNSASDANFTQFLEYQKGTGNAVRMVMQIFENPNNSSLDEVIKREGLLNSDELGPKFEYYSIGGHDAVKLTKTMTQTEICNDGDGSTKNRIFYFLVKGDGFVVEIHPNDSCESFKRNWFDITPQSFSFIK